MANGNGKKAKVATGDVAVDFAEERKIERVLDLDHMTMEERAKLNAAHGDLRGLVLKITGSLSIVRGRLACSNAMVAPDTIRTELIMLRASADAALDAIKTIAS